MKRIAPVLSVIGFLGLLAGISSGYALCGYDWTYMANPMGEDVEINTAECGIDPDSARLAVIAGQNTWNTEGEADFQFTYGGTTTRLPESYDYHNVVGFEDDYSQDYVAVTYIWTNYAGDDILECDMRFNTYNYNWHGGYGACPPTRMDVWNVATHEHGHMLCLGDLYGAGDSEKTMYGYVSYGETKKRTLHSDDIAGIQAIYGAAPNPPVADFEGSPTSGYAPLTVNFTDLSTGSITSWKWYFGDGTRAPSRTRPIPTRARDSST